MSPLRHNRGIFTFFFVCFAIFAATTPLSAQSISGVASSSQASTVDAVQASYPADPPSEIPWSAARAGWSDMVAAFNSARIRESALLGLDLPAFDFPSATEWANMRGDERALWLINQERVVRGLAPLHGLEANINAVAQGYAEWLLANNQFAHDADGNSPWARLDANPAIGECHDFLGIAENLYFLASTSSNALPLVLEQAIYRMLYEDAGSGWGHRHAMLWDAYTENSGAPDREGFLGIGHAQGGYTIEDNGTYYPNTHIIVMNFFDPCATWKESATPTVTPTAAPSASPMPTASATPTPSPTPIASATPTPAETPTPTFQTRAVSGQVKMAAVAEQAVTEAVVSNGVDKGNPGLAGVTISSRDGQTTQTDNNGNFTLAGLPPGTHTLIASKAGYTFAPPSITVDLSTRDVAGLLIEGIAGPVGTDLSFALHLPLILPNR